MKKITIDGTVYVPETSFEAGKLIIVIVDNRGLAFVGYSTLKPDEETGMIKISKAQCVIRWFTGAHLNHLTNGICEGVALGAEADVFVKEFYCVIPLPFETKEEWKGTKTAKGKLETF